MFLFCDLETSSGSNHVTIENRGVEVIHGEGQSSSWAGLGWAGLSGGCRKAAWAFGASKVGRSCGLQISLATTLTEREGRGTRTRRVICKKGRQSPRGCLRRHPMGIDRCPSPGRVEGACSCLGHGPVVSALAGAQGPSILHCGGCFRGAPGAP